MWWPRSPAQQERNERSMNGNQLGKTRLSLRVFFFSVIFLKQATNCERNSIQLGFTRFYWVFTGFYWVVLGFTGFYWVLLGFTKFYRVLPCFTGFNWFLLVFTRFYRVLFYVIFPKQATDCERNSVQLGKARKRLPRWLCHIDRCRQEPYNGSVLTDKINSLAYNGPVTEPTIKEYRLHRKPRRFRVVKRNVGWRNGRQTKIAPRRYLIDAQKEWRKNTNRWRLVGPVSSTNNDEIIMNGGGRATR